MSLSEALSDIKEALKSGSELTDDLINEIAADHEIKPLFLKRVITENNITAESVKKFEEATKDNFEERLKKAIAETKKRYGLPDDDHRYHDVMYNGIRYTILCRSRSKIIMVSHEDCTSHWCNYAWYQNAKRVETKTNA
jgi:hypothetical protein